MMDRCHILLKEIIYLSIWLFSHDRTLEFLFFVSRKSYVRVSTLSRQKKKKEKNPVNT